jgi:hypothetical protein
LAAESSRRSWTSKAAAWYTIGRGVFAHERISAPESVFTI